MTTWERGREVASASKRPLTILRSGAMERRYSYVALSVRLPKHSVWPILPGVRSFLNYRWHVRGTISVERGIYILLQGCRELGLVYEGPLLREQVGRSWWKEGYEAGRGLWKASEKIEKFVLGFRDVIQIRITSSYSIGRLEELGRTASDGGELRAQWRGVSVVEWWMTKPFHKC